MTEPDFDKGDGLIPVIVQESETGEVLMLAYMNAEAWRETLRTGKATYWSRSRQTLWVKGESSGHVQQVQEIRIDCDRDTLLLKVRQVGDAACHTGYQSCFYRAVKPKSPTDLEFVAQKVYDPATAYQKK